MSYNERTVRLLGPQAVEKLAAAKVILFGVGGVGGRRRADAERLRGVAGGFVSVPRNPCLKQFLGQIEGDELSDIAVIVNDQNSLSVFIFFYLASCHSDSLSLRIFNFSNIKCCIHQINQHLSPFGIAYCRTARCIFTVKYGFLRNSAPYFYCIFFS